MDDTERCRTRVRATFVRRGSMRNDLGAIERTLLFRDVLDVETGQLLRDHIWLRDDSLRRKARGLDMRGVTVEITVMIAPALKGYLGDPLSRRAIDLPRPRVEIALYEPSDLSFQVNADGFPI
jgi:hypothetical protein